MSGNEQEFDEENQEWRWGDGARRHPGRSTQASRAATVSRLEHTGARVALARIDRERRRLALEEELILSRPDEPIAEDGDGPVVYFRKTFTDRSPEGQGYQYVAVRVAGINKWFLSGNKAKTAGYTWEELLHWVSYQESEMPPIWLASAWEEVVKDHGEG